MEAENVKIIEYLNSIEYNKVIHPNPNFRDSFKYIKHLGNDNSLVCVIEFYEDGGLQMMCLHSSVSEDELTYWYEKNPIYDTFIIDPSIEEFKVFENVINRLRISA
ncbi:hypothetical protein [Pedobacter antarcticus]|uniref:hypothetical protein n=1 Tax=Pedobacter antarcticus TaxID=34086 RepID=UPI00292CBE05|nr:hypothetical protein [Pedobacter antarcticus]